MTKIYSYVLRVDDGAAPNPFWGICTLVICKPRIRKSAEVGDWIVGTGSKRVKLADGKICDFSNKIVYAMKVTEKMTLCEYDGFCRKNLNKKSLIGKMMTGDFVLETVFMITQKGIIQFYGKECIKKNILIKI